ncbi:uracil-DNA glycosylase [bacterium]|nr:uracil-DNA glycosylase [candidate division CSSED10-310 bacterium]
MDTLKETPVISAPSVASPAHEELKRSTLTESDHVPDIEADRAYEFERAVTGVATNGTNDDRELRLAELRNYIGECRRCPLHLQRTRLVFGEGNPAARLMLVGEGPGSEEDRTGRPFIGKAGQLLDRIIAAMGLDRKDVFIGNVVKCRPPGNRDPEPDEIAVCRAFLDAQIDIIRPQILLALGKISGRVLTGIPDATLASLRGVFYQYRQIDLRVTYHPAALLRNPAYRRPVWEDIQTIMARLGLPVPPVKS